MEILWITWQSPQTLCKLSTIEVVEEPLGGGVHRPIGLRGPLDGKRPLGKKGTGSKGNRKNPSTENGNRLKWEQAKPSRTPTGRIGRIGEQASRPQEGKN
jgi:hypothetical protein